MSINIQTFRKTIRNRFQTCRVRIGKWLWKWLIRPFQTFRKTISNCLQACRVWIGKWRWKWLISAPVQIVGLILIYLGAVGFNFGLDWFSFPDLSPKTRIKNYAVDYQDLITYKLNYRDARFKAVSGLAVLIGLWIAYHRLRIADEEKMTKHEEQMTNRFAKAVELLANEDTAVRLGALYALERIANDSDKDYDAIIETIAAYVRSRAPLPAPKSKEEAKNTTQEAEPKVKEDISAAIHILGRRKKLEHPKIFLNDTDLSGLKLTAKCDFSNASFQNARLSHADLRQAILTRANLLGVGLQFVHLKWANLKWANLEKANLDWANLKGAKLLGAHLEGVTLKVAKLYEANFSEANLKGANLEWANLKEAKLHEANFSEAKNLKWEQLEYAQHNPQKYLAGAELPGYLLENPPDWYRLLMERETAEEV